MTVRGVNNEIFSMRKLSLFLLVPARIERVLFHFKEQAMVKALTERFTLPWEGER
jgi:hypothetical protein